MRVQSTKVLPIILLVLIYSGPTAQSASRPQDEASIQASGTGFFITVDGYLLTNFHVVDKANHIVIKVKQETYEAKVITIDAVNDVALLKVSGKFNALPIASSRTVRLGDSIFTIGYPNPEIQGVEAKLTKGEINSLTGIQDDPRHFQISVPVQPGNSGGPLVNQVGNVVGIVAARLDDLKALKSTGSLPQNVNYAVKSSFAVAFLETIPEVTAKLIEPFSGPGPGSENVIRNAQDATALIMVLSDKGQSHSQSSSGSRVDQTKPQMPKAKRTPDEIMVAANSICISQPRGGNPVLELEVRRKVENWGRLTVVDGPDEADLVLEVTQLGDYDPNNHYGTYASAMAVLRESQSRQQLWSVKKGSYWSFSSLSIDLIAGQISDAVVKFLNTQMKKKRN
jgi:S1-C subfamily serine protease